MISLAIWKLGATTSAPPSSIAFLACRRPLLFPRSRQSSVPRLRIFTIISAPSSSNTCHEDADCLGAKTECTERIISVTDGINSVFGKLGVRMTTSPFSRRSNPS
jgi:hypothetical protein